MTSNLILDQPLLKHKLRLDGPEVANDRNQGMLEGVLLPELKRLQDYEGNYHAVGRVNTPVMGLQ